MARSESVSVLRRSPDRIVSRFAILSNTLLDIRFRAGAKTSLSSGLPKLMAATMLTSVFSVGLTTCILMPLARVLPLDAVLIVYLIPVIVAATRWGAIPAMAAAFLAAGAVDFFFIPPFYSLRSDNPQDAIDLCLFMLVALTTGTLASQLHKEADSVRSREAELQRLYDFSRRLATCFTVSDLTLAIQAEVTRALARKNAVFLPVIAGRLDAAAAAGTSPEIAAKATELVEAKAARSFLQHGADQTIWLLSAVRSPSCIYGVIAVDTGKGSVALIDEQAHEMERILADTASAFQRLDLETAMAEAATRRQTELLKDAVHSTLSHEFRSPLTTIIGAAEVLSKTDIAHNNASVHSLIDMIGAEAARLDDFVNHLLNVTAVTAGGFTLRREWTDPKDIVNAAVNKRSRKLAKHRMTIRFIDKLPLIEVDAPLIEDAIGQLLENAAKYSAMDTTILVVTRSDGDHVIITVSDEGDGLTSADLRCIGQRSFRSQRHVGNIPGLGLGLWITTTFIRANGGSVSFSSGGIGLGTTAILTLPINRFATAQATGLYV